VIRLAEPEIGEPEVQAAADVLRSGRLVQGEHVLAFERAVARYVRVREAVAVSSGTAALQLALLALEVGPGDEVIVPDFTYPATANVVELVGATPVLVDIDLGTFNVAPEAVRAAVNARTRAVVPVHLFGQAAEMEPLEELCRARGIALVEDAACALGGEYRGTRCGAFGAVGCFSFHPRKVITTGEGGMLTTNDPAIAERLRSLRNHGAVVCEGRTHFERAGFNYRMTDFQGAIGVAQMQRLEGLLARRRELAECYARALADAPELVRPRVLPGVLPTWQSYVVLLPEGVDREQVQARLREAGVESTLGTYSLSAQPHYARRAGRLPNSRTAFDRSLGVPLHPRMAPADVGFVAARLKEALGGRR
jgi:perosamine synthetase